MDLVEVGYVARAHGLRGELSLRTHDPTSTVYESVDRLHIAGTAYTVVSVRPSAKFVIVRLDGITNRSAAEALRGNAVHVARDALPMDDGEVLLSDLVGLRVLAADGVALGEVHSIEMGPQDRLVVRDEHVERLIPFVPALVVDVDFDSETVTVDLPDEWPETPL